MSNSAQSTANPYCSVKETPISIQEALIQMNTHLNAGQAEQA